MSATSTLPPPCEDHGTNIPWCEERNSAVAIRSLPEETSSAFPKIVTPIKPSGTEGCLEKLRVAHNKAALFLYRTFAVVTLYGVLILVFAYAFYMGFYAINTSWIAPFIAVPTNDRILDLTSKIVMSKQTLASTIVNRDSLGHSLQDMKKELAQLDRLDRAFQDAIEREKAANESDGPELSGLDAQKVVDNQNTKAIMDQVANAKAEIEKDLQAGLIAKGDAAAQIASLNSIANSYTDAQIAEVLVRAGVRQKSNADVTAVDTLSKEAELKGNIVQLQLQILTGEEQLRVDEEQIAQLQEAIKTAQGSPYFQATKKDVQFAFVPYNNRNNIGVGTPVFGCFLNMILCHQVGTVKQVFRDEEHTNHPVFKSEIRGSLIQLDLTEKEAAKDSVLFVNRKPLGL